MVDPPNWQVSFRFPLKLIPERVFPFGFPLSPPQKLRSSRKKGRQTHGFLPGATLRTTPAAGSRASVRRTSWSLGDGSGDEPHRGGVGAWTRFFLVRISISTGGPNWWTSEFGQVAFRPSRRPPVRNGSRPRASSCCLPLETSRPCVSLVLRPPLIFVQRGAKGKGVTLQGEARDANQPCPPSPSSLLRWALLPASRPKTGGMSDLVSGMYFVPEPLKGGNINHGRKWASTAMFVFASPSPATSSQTVASHLSCFLACPQ